MYYIFVIIFLDPKSELSCAELIAEVNYNVSSDDASDWFYAEQPDVDECRLQWDECHVNATCHNVHLGYECHCNRGFVGDGKMFCNET